LKAKAAPGVFGSRVTGTMWHEVSENSKLGNERPKTTSCFKKGYPVRVEMGMPIAIPIASFKY